MRCCRLDGCPFFKETLRSMPALSELYRNQYCLGDNSTCSRNYLYLESKGYNIDDAEEAVMEKLSRTLCPNELTKVRTLFPI